MRGKVVHGNGVCDIVGITPAHAGKSLQYGCPGSSCRDHPRVCGEKNGFVASAAIYPGSPLRIQGKELAAHCPNQVPGITPAYAGKRLCHLR